MSASPASLNGTLASYAASCRAAGLCTLPAIREQKRVALPRWKQYQDRLPTSEEVTLWINEATAQDAMCIVCGEVSGHLEMIDFDLGGEAFGPWCTAVKEQAPGLLERLVIETTPSGGHHVVYRCQQPVAGNHKLAQRR